MARGDRPGEEVAVLVKCSEEAVLFSPDQVVCLAAHSDTVHDVQVRDGDHRQVVEVGDEREALRKRATRHATALPSDCRR